MTISIRLGAGAVDGAGSSNTTAGTNPAGTALTSVPARYALRQANSSELEIPWRRAVAEVDYLRPADLHAGNHTAIIEHRQAALDAAHAAHPERFTARPRPAKVPTKAWINRPSIQTS